MIKLPKKPRFYWAYGSNLNVKAMRYRCPDAKKVCPLYLPNGMLVFRGVADVIVSIDTDAKVAGGLWLISKRDELILDNYEGVRYGLYTKEEIVLEIKGEQHSCLYYQMAREGIMPPADSYLQTIVQGYRDFDLDFSLLDKAVAHSFEEKEVTPYLAKRREAAKSQVRWWGKSK